MQQLPILYKRKLPVPSPIRKIFASQKYASNDRLLIELIVRKITKNGPAGVPLGSRYGPVMVPLEGVFIWYALKVKGEEIGMLWSITHKIRVIRVIR